MKIIIIICFLFILQSCNNVSQKAPLQEAKLQHIENVWLKKAYNEKKLYSKLMKDYEDEAYLAGAGQQSLEFQIAASMNRLYFYTDMAKNFNALKYQSALDSFSSQLLD